MRIAAGVYVTQAAIKLLGHFQHFDMFSREEMARRAAQDIPNGAYVNLVMPPASPTVHSLLRCSVSAAHSPEQIDAIVAAFAGLLESPSVST